MKAEVKAWPHHTQKGKKLFYGYAAIFPGYLDVRNIALKVYIGMFNDFFNGDFILMQQQ